MNEILHLLSKHRGSIMGFAILWVMVRHLPFNTGYDFFDFFKTIGYGGVDIFLFLSGFGLYYSVSKPNYNLKDFYRSRFFRIMPEFWAVLLVVYLVESDFSFRSFLTFVCKASTLGYWVKLPYDLWYISCILLLYAIYPLYIRLFKQKGIVVTFSFICFGFFLMLIYALVCFFAFDMKNIGGLLILSFARIPIFFIGALFGHWAKDGCDIVLTSRIKIGSILSAIIALLLLAFFIRFVPDGLWICSLYFIPFIVITPVLCIILAILFDKLIKIDRLFSCIGLISLELYLCHDHLYDTIDFFSKHLGERISCLLVVLLSFLSALLLYVINKKFLKKIE